MCSYLNSDRAVYAFRRSVPEHLRPYFLTASGKQRTEWRISLLTKDRPEAKRRCHLQAVETDRWISEAQVLFDAGIIAQATPSRGAEQRKERQFLYDQEALAWREEQNFTEESQIEGGKDEEAAILDQLRGPRSELSRAQAAMRNLIPDHEFDLPEEKKLAADARKRDWERAALESLPRIASLLGGRAASSIRGLFDGYATDAGLEPATVKRWKAVIEKFIAHLGHDNADRVQESDVRAWKAALGDEARSGGALSAITIRDVYIAAVKATFNWGIEEGRVKSNPASAVKVRA